MHFYDKTEGPPTSEAPFNPYGIVFDNENYPRVAYVDTFNEYSHLDDDCPIDEVACRNPYQCIPKSAICDGKKDCLEGSDEEDCLMIVSEDIHDISDIQEMEVEQAATGKDVLDVVVMLWMLSHVSCLENSKRNRRSKDSANCRTA